MLGKSFFRQILIFCFLGCSAFGMDTYPTSIDHTDYPQILEHVDEDIVRSVLLEETPFFEVRSVIIISHGWDNSVADVNDEWIFRSPKKKAVADKLIPESILLDALRPLVRLPIPHYEIMGNRFCFVAYRKIYGVELTKVSYEELNCEERESLADDIAQFLYSLHNLFSINEAKTLGFTKNVWPINWLRYDLVGNLPSDELNAMLVHALENGEELIHSNVPFVLGHHDLHGGNMAFDTEMKQLNGIFDFSDAAIGIIYRDFSELISIHYKLSEDVSRIYLSYSHCHENLDEFLYMVGVDYQLRKFTCLLCAIEDSDQPRYDRILKELRAFAEDWEYR